MTVEEIKAKYPFLYETHMHTKEASACARCSGDEMARAYKEAGYAGVIVTDHNWGGNTCVDRSLPWEEWLDLFFTGYDNAKKTGDEIGLQVFRGYEAGYGGPEFLIYGLEKEDMKKHPEIKTASPEEQYKLVKELGGMVIQAHPYREEWYIDKVRLFPDCVDGAETINATHSSSKSTSHNKPVFDERAVVYAKEHEFPQTAGSDQHSTFLFGGGVAFPTKLESIQDYIKRIINKEDYVLTNGEAWYDNQGNVIARNF